MGNAIRALKHYNFKLHISGQAISLIGTWMQRVAISWLVYRTTNSAFLLGLITFAGLIPSLILSPYAGSYADRHNRYRLLLLTQIGLMIQSGILAYLIWKGHQHILTLGILTFIQGIINSFDTTTRQSLMAEIVPDKNDLPNAIALNSSVFNAARLVGPAVAGIILSSYGEVTCFFINFLSFIAVIITLLFMKLELKSKPKPKENIWQGLSQGFSFLKHSRDLLNLILVLAGTSLLVIPFSTLLPVFAKDVFNGNATTFSWYESSAGFGAMIGALYMAFINPKTNFKKQVFIAGLVFAISLVLLAVVKVLFLSLLFTAIASTGMMIQTSSTNTFIQTHAPEHMRSRIISYYIMAFQGVLPLGSLLIGALAHRLGTPYTVFLQGIAGIAIMLCFFRLRSQRLKHQSL